MKKLLLVIAGLLGGAIAAAAPSETPSSVKLGVMALPFTAPAPSASAPFERGVLITEVLPGSVAASAGLVPGDLLTAIDGTPVTTPDDVRTVFASRHAGERVRLAVTRAHDHRELTATVASSPVPIVAPTSWLATVRGVLDRVIPKAIAGSRLANGVV